MKPFCCLFLLLWCTYPIYCGESSEITIANGLPQNTISGIEKDKYGFLWFSTWNGLCRWDGYNFRIYKSVENDPTTILDNRILSMYCDSLMNLWIMTNNSLLCRYVYEKDRFERLKPESVKSYIYNELKNRVGQLPYREYDGIGWTGTSNNGVVKRTLHSQPFRIWTSEKSSNPQLPDNNVRAITIDRNENVWIGSNDKGLTCYNRISGKVQHYEKNLCDTLSGLISNKIRRIYCDQFGFIWIGTKDGLDRFDSRTGKFYHYHPNLPKKIPHHWVYWITEDSRNNLWIGTWGGIAVYDRKADLFHAFPVKKTVLNPQVRVIVEDSSKALWIATQYAGIIKLEEKDKGEYRRTIFSHQKGNAASLSSNRIYSMTLSREGILWVGTSRGLSLIDTRNNQVSRLNLPFGEEAVYGILTAKKDVWVSLPGRIARIDKATRTCRMFRQNDGLQLHEFNEDAYYFDKYNNELFWGGPGGLLSFNPDRITDDQIKPQTVLTRLFVNNEEVKTLLNFNDRIVLQKPLYLTKEIELDFSERNISIEFAALHFIYPEDNRYRYRLIPLDTVWKETGADIRMAVYKNLKPGRYTFQVYSSNCDGVWSFRHTELSVLIYQPWWNTLLSKLLYFLAASGLLVFMFQFLRNRKKMRVLKKENEQKAQIVKNIIKLNNTKHVENEGDKEFMKQVDAIIEKNISNADFSVEMLISEMSMGRSRLFTRLKNIKNETPQEYIKGVRMRHAAKLLLSGKFTIYEIAWQSGYSDHSNFTRSFNKFFGMSPRTYLKMNANGGE